MTTALIPFVTHTYVINRVAWDDADPYANTVTYREEAGGSEARVFIGEQYFPNSFYTTNDFDGLSEANLFGAIASIIPDTTGTYSRRETNADQMDVTVSYEVGEISWGGNTTQVLRVVSESMEYYWREGSVQTFRTSVITLGGDPLPPITDLQSWDAWYEAITGEAPIASGPGAPGDLVDILGIPGASSTEADIVPGPELGVHLFTGVGNDRIEGLGRGTIDGGSGSDTLVIARADLAQLASTGRVVSVENLEGTSAPDTLLGDEAVNAIDGGRGNDTIKGRGGDDKLVGGDGDDTLSGGTGDDEISGGAGSDRIVGGLNHDVIEGGDGDDHLKGEQGNDVVSGNGGDDRIYGGFASDYLAGGVGFDQLHGGQGHDRLEGNSGHDTLYGDRGDDTLHGNAGADSLFGSTGSDTLFGGANNDILHGEDGNDKLSGSNGSDALFGGRDRDILRGNAGADTLDGGAGDDILDGGIGADTFVFGQGADIIVGFGNDVDTIQLQAELLGISGLSVPQVLLRYGAISDGHVLMDFGAGNTLTVRNIGELASLANDLEII